MHNLDLLHLLLLLLPDHLQQQHRVLEGSPGLSLDSGHWLVDNNLRLYIVNTNLMRTDQ